MKEEMASMQRIDSIFSKIARNLRLKGKYEAEQINFDCLRPTMEAYEKQCGRLSDYGLIYVKYFAEACAILPYAQIIS
jgi:hypothetical protein